MDPGKVPEEDLFRHVEYDDGSQEVFLQNLWRDLYGDGPAGPAGTFPAGGPHARTGSRLGLP
jgi:hypothetical protein